MSTATLDLFKGVSLWAIAMVIPVIMMCVPNATARIILLTLIYPTMLSFFSRFGHFWVSHGVVYAACGLTLLFSWLLTLSPQAKDAIENPEKNEAIAGSVMGSILALFLIIMFVASKWGISMYDISNFNKNANSV